MTEIRSLMQEDIPAAKRALGENYANLQQVAEYVENNYAKVGEHISKPFPWTEPSGVL
uniref:Uncharacterized protein n=1 Tax=Callorhinchus milii TaxID=7868 RepID=A0A4W3GIQ1_CALMI